MRKAKTLIIGLLTVVLLASLVFSPGCARPAEEEEKLLIVAAVHYPTHASLVPPRIGAEDAAEEYGVDFEWLGPPDWDILGLIKTIETVLVEGELDGLMVETTNPVALVPVIKRVKEAGIPVVLWNELNEQEGFDHFCGADGIELGKLIGESMELNLLGEGVWAKAVGYEGTGEVSGKIAFITDAPGMASLEMRLKGAKEYLSQFPGIVDVGTYDVTITIPGAREATTNILIAHPDLAGFISVGSGPTEAAGMTVDDMGLSGKVIIAGMDTLPLTLQLIQDKVVASTQGQGYYYQGYLPAKALAEYLLYGTPIPKFMPTELETVTLENVDFIIEREEAYMAGR